MSVSVPLLLCWRRCLVLRALPLRGPDRVGAAEAARYSRARRNIARGPAAPATRRKSRPEKAAKERPSSTHPVPETPLSTAVAVSSNVDEADLLAPCLRGAFRRCHGSLFLQPKINLTFLFF